MTATTAPSAIRPSTPRLTTPTRSAQHLAQRAEREHAAGENRDREDAGENVHGL